MDGTDTRMISLLRADARMPVADIARALGLARTTVQARLDRLVRNGTITGFTLSLGSAARPLMRATALLQIEPRSGPAVLARLKSLPGVDVVHTTSGRCDLLVEISAATPADLDRTLDSIGEARGVRSSESLIHLTTKFDRRA